MLWVEKALSGKSSEEFPHYLEIYHDSGSESFYARRHGSAVCLVRAGMVEAQDRIDVRSVAKAEDSRDPGAEFGSLAGRIGQGQEAFWLAGGRHGGQLLRGGPGRLLAASLLDDAGSQERGGRSGELESESATQACEDGSDRCAALVGQPFGSRGRQETRLERGACADLGAGGSSAVASRVGDAARRADRARQSTEESV